MYRIICAWCGLDLGAAPKGCQGNSHGICDKCRKEQDQLLEQMVKEQKR